MKKSFLALLSAATLLCSCGFSACEERHVHSYTETVVFPTCTERGYTIFRCSCGEQFKNLYVDALGHEFTDYVLEETEDGEIKTALCNRGCGQTDEIKDTAIFTFEDGAITGLTSFGKTLTVLAIPEEIGGKKVEKILSLALSQGKSLERVTIPASITYIEAGAFYHTEISEFFVDSKNMAYKAYNGDLYTKNGTTFVCYATGKSETEFSVPYEVERIEAGAFAFSKKLERITVSSSVSRIGGLCFEGCESLSSISLSPRISYIAFGTFRGCVRLESIEFPPELEEIEDSAFEGCKLLKNVVFPASLECLGTLVFYGCTKLESVTFSKECEWVLQKENYKKILNSKGLNQDVKTTARYFTNDYALYAWLKNGAEEREDNLWTGFY